MCFLLAQPYETFFLGGGGGGGGGGGRGEGVLAVWHNQMNMNSTTCLLVTFL